MEVFFDTAVKKRSTITTAISISIYMFSHLSASLVHMIQRSSTWLWKSEGGKHSLTDLTIKMQPAWHDFRAEKCYNISESLLYIRRRTHCFDLPKDISFMKINGVSLNQNHGRTVYWTPVYFGCIFLGWNKQMHTLFICVLPWCFFFLTPTPAQARCKRKTEAKGISCS